MMIPRADGEQLVGLEVPPYGDINERQCHGKHNAVAPVYVIEACGTQEVLQLRQGSLSCSMLASRGRKSRELAVVGAGALGVFWICEQSRHGDRGR